MGKCRAGIAILGLFLLLGLVAGRGATGVQAQTTHTVCDDSSCDFSSIQEAIDDEDVEAAETIEVQGGTYEESVTIDKSITLQGVDNPTVSFVHDAQNPGRPTIDIVVDDVTVDGFTIERKVEPDVYDGGLRHAQAIKLGGYAATGGSGATVSNNVLQFTGSPDPDDVAAHGIMLLDPENGGDLDDVTVEGNEIRGFPNTGFSLLGFYDDAVTGVTFDSNQLEGNTIQVDDGDAALNLDDVVDSNSFDLAARVIGGSTIFSSIQDAVDQTADGDTVEVRDGTYEGPVLVGTANLTLQAANSQGATITYTDTSGTPTVGITADGVTLSGFTIERGSSGNNFAQGVRVAGSDVTVSNNAVNKVTGNGYEDDQGISVLDGPPNASVSNVSIQGNTVTGFSNGIGVATQTGDGVDGVAISGGSVTGSQYGIGVSETDAAEGPSPANVTIEGVNISGNDHGIYVFGDSDGTDFFADADASEIAAHGNSITGNSASGATNSGTGTLDATENWWGAGDGPGGEGPGSGNEVSTGVDFSPWCADEACEDEGAGGTVEEDGSATTDTEGDGATESDPVEATVTHPDGGTISIEESETTGTAPEGFQFLGHQVEISVDPDGDVEDPIQITFRLHTSLAGDDPTMIDIVKDGTIVEDCTGAPDAVPDPCVQDVDVDGDELVFTVLTSEASTWNFAQVTSRPVHISKEVAGEGAPELESVSGTIAPGDPTEWTIDTVPGSVALDVSTDAQTVTETSPGEDWTVEYARVDSSEGTCGPMHVDEEDWSTDPVVIPEGSGDYLVCIRNTYDPDTRTVTIAKQLAPEDAPEPESVSGTIEPGEPTTWTIEPDDETHRFGVTEVELPATEQTITETSPSDGWTVEYAVTSPEATCGTDHIGEDDWSTDPAVVPAGTQDHLVCIRNTYLDVPGVTDVTPDSGPVEGGTEVTITGEGFDEATAVFFGEEEVDDFTAVSDTEIETTSPEAEEAGEVFVRVRNDNGPSAESDDAIFTYEEDPGLVPYELFARWTLLTWQGLDGIDLLTALEGDDDDAETNDISDVVTAVWYYDSSTADWQAAFPGQDIGIPGASDLHELDYGEAYWVAITVETIIWTVEEGEAPGE